MTGRDSRRKILRAVLLVVGFGCLIYLFRSLGPENVLSLLTTIGWRFVLIVLMYSVQEVVRTFALRACLPRSSRISFRVLLHNTFAGEAVRSLTPMGSWFAEPARAWFMKKRGVHSSHAASSIIAEYLAHSFASAFLTILAALYFLYYFQATHLRVAAMVLLYGSTGYLILSLILLMCRVNIVRIAGKVVSLLPGLRKAVNARMDSIRLIDESIHLILRNPVSLAWLLFLQFVSHAMMFVETYYSILFMGVSVSLLVASIQEALTKLVSVALFLGPAEGVYALMFHALGMPAAAGLALSLLKRLRSIAFALPGLGALSLIDRRG